MPDLQHPRVVGAALMLASLSFSANAFSRDTVRKVRLLQVSHFDEKGEPEVVKAPPPPVELPKRHAEFREFPLTSIKPQGWLRAWLEIQQKGLSGHLEDVKGRLKSPIRAQALFFRGLPAHYAVCKDKTILDRLVKHYLACKQRGDDGRCDYVDIHGPVNIEILGWLYLETGDQRMLDLALEMSEPTFAHGIGGLQSFVDRLNTTPPKQLDFSNEHGVLLMEKIMEMTLLYICTGQRKYITAAENAFRAVDDKYMLPDGCIVAREFMHPDNSSETHETCVINNLSWTAGYLLEATGDARWADRQDVVVRLDSLALRAGSALPGKASRMLIDQASLVLFNNGSESG